MRALKRMAAAGLGLAGLGVSTPVWAFCGAIETPAFLFCANEGSQIVGFGNYFINNLQPPPGLPFGQPLDLTGWSYEDYMYYQETGLPPPGYPGYPGNGPGDPGSLREAIQQANQANQPMLVFLGRDGQILQGGGSLLPPLFPTNFQPPAPGDAGGGIFFPAPAGPTGLGQFTGDLPSSGPRLDRTLIDQGWGGDGFIDSVLPPPATSGGFLGGLFGGPTPEPIPPSGLFFPPPDLPINPASPFDSGVGGPGSSFYGPDGNFIGSGPGGGILSPGGPLTITNSTITGNTITGNQPGGGTTPPAATPPTTPPVQGETVGSFTFMNQGTGVDLTIVKTADGKTVGIGPDGHNYGPVHPSKGGWGWRFDGQPNLPPAPAPSSPGATTGSSQGGGILSSGGTVTITSSTITGNQPGGGTAPPAATPPTTPPVQGETVGSFTFMNQGTGVDLTIVKTADGKTVGIGPDGHNYGPVHPSAGGYGWRFDGAPNMPPAPAPSSPGATTGAGATSGSGQGGGIFSPGGTPTITNSVIGNNTASPTLFPTVTGNNAALPTLLGGSGQGGGVFNSGPLNITIVDSATGKPMTGPNGKAYCDPCTGGAGGGIDTQTLFQIGGGAPPANGGFKIIITPVAPTAPAAADHAHNNLTREQMTRFIVRSFFQ